jgi:hypothetical protein
VAVLVAVAVVEYADETEMIWFSRMVSEEVRGARVAMNQEFAQVEARVAMAQTPAIEIVQQSRLRVQPQCLLLTAQRLALQHEAEPKSPLQRTAQHLPL